MVDWYSKENRDFSLELLEELPCSWLTVPGNHDYQSYEVTPNGILSISAVEGKTAAATGWKERGIELHNRYVEARRYRSHPAEQCNQWSRRGDKGVA